jgi:hypothetical protein
MDKRIKSLRHLDAQDGTVYGKYNKLNMVNPYKSFFVAHYADGSMVKGKDLFNTGWSDIKDGITLLQFQLSTGHLISIPKFSGYLPLIEVSESMEGFRLFHAINVNCLADNKVMSYKIILKEDQLQKYKIGDIIVTTIDKPVQSTHWKMAA